MTRFAVLLVLATLWHASQGWTFVPGRHRSLPATLHFAQKPHREAVFGGDIDVKKATDMADHFGKYPVEEVEEMRSALHTDRLQHYTNGNAGFRSGLNPDEEIGRLLLEEDLNLQARLLHDVNGHNGQDRQGALPGAMYGPMAAKHHEPHIVEHLDEKVAPNNQAQPMFSPAVHGAIMLCLVAAVLLGMPRVAALN